MEGSLALAWGAEDIVSLAKQIVRLAEDKQFAPFENRGGVTDGAKLTPEQVKEVSKWPTRQEQLSIVLGQINSPGASLVSQLLSVGSALVSQIQQKAEGSLDQAASPSGET
jgi:large subunit ribosomal protein L10